MSPLACVYTEVELTNFSRWLNLLRVSQPLNYDQMLFDVRICSLQSDKIYFLLGLSPRRSCVFSMAENSKTCFNAMSNLHRFGWVEVTEDLKALWNPSRAISDHGWSVSSEDRTFHILIGVKGASLRCLSPKLI